VNKQSLASVVRQVVAVVATVFGILTASVQALHLPPVISGILTAFGPLLLTVEHFVGDPSTGTQYDTTTTTVPPTSA
jgi:hypothetical protein